MLATPGQGLHVQCRYHRSKDGSVFPCEITGRHVAHEGRSLLPVTVRDITDSKRLPDGAGAERDFAYQVMDSRAQGLVVYDREGRYRALLEQAPIGIYRTTPDGRLLAANPALVSMLGYESFAELAARNLEADGFEPGYDRAAFKHAVERDGEIRGLDAVWHAKDGTPVFMRESARAIRAPDGALLCYEGKVEDISKSAAAEAGHRRLAAAEEVLRQRSARLEAPREVSLEIAAELDVKGLLRTTTERAQTLVAEMEQLVVVDELTKLLNRRALFSLGAREVERARRFGHPLAAQFIDLDHFKALNDRYSLRVGDAVLREVGARIIGSIREIDLAARFGGEEFVVLLVETDVAAVHDVAERLRQAVETISFAIEQGPALVTVSFGVATVHPGAADLEALLHRADGAMYAAKLAGRNRVVVEDT